MSVFRCFVVSAAVLCVSCATAGSHAGRTPRPSSAFLESDEPLFEDGVDMIGYPQGLSGRWADDWGRELRDRVQRSDLIATVTVDTLTTDISPEKRSTHRLVAVVGESLKGDYEGELRLASSTGAIGYGSVERERRNLLRKPMVVFVKWASDDVGAVRARWHLASASEDILAAIHVQLGEAPKDKHTVVEHTH